MFNSMRFADDVQQTLDHLRHSVDQLFNGFYSPSGWREEGRREWAFSPAIETVWEDDALRLRAIVPGVAEKDLKVTVQNGQLAIEGERKSPDKGSGFRHLAYGKFFTSVTLPNGVDTEKIACRLRDGILEITVPVAEQMKPRQIPIHAGEERKALAA
jgi:HSP20 family protein